MLPPVRLLTRSLIVGSLLLASASAFAQPPGPPPGRPAGSVPAPGDSLRTLSGPTQVWLHVGPGWLGAPSSVRQRYRAGLGIGVSGDRRLANLAALRARLDYTDMPSTQPTSILVGGRSYTVGQDYGHGWSGSAMGGAAVQPLPHLWIEGAGGVGYFRNGFPSGDTIQDLGTGRDIPLEARSGWGAIWGTGVRYEFQPSRRDRLLAEFQFATLERDGTRLRFFAIRFGYRAL